MEENNFTLILFLSNYEIYASNIFLSNYEIYISNIFVISFRLVVLCPEKGKGNNIFSFSPSFLAGKHFTC